MPKKKIVVFVFICFFYLSTRAGAQEASFDYGGDLRFRVFYRQADETFDKNDKKTRDLYQIRGRLFGAVSLFDEMLELQGQIRMPHYFGDDYADHLNDSKIEIDLANFKLNNIFDWPFELTVGKQELRYGEGFLTGDRDVFRDFTEDDPENFTAVKLRFLADRFWLDGFYSRIYQPDASLPDYIGEHDFAGVVAHYEFASLEAGPEDDNGAERTFLSDDFPEDTFLAGRDSKYVIEPYLFFNNDLSRKLHNHPNKIKVWIVGGRAAGEILENFRLKGEICYEWGDFRNYSFPLPKRDYRSWGGYLGGEYCFPYRYSPSLALTLINFTGEEYPDSGDYNAFHPLFRSERFGELHTKYTEDNKRIFRTTFRCQPADKFNFLLEWFDYQAIEKPLDREGKHDGDEIDLRLDYQFNEHLSFALFTGWFIPGDYFPGGVITRRSGDDVRMQIMGEMGLRF